MAAYHEAVGGDGWRDEIPTFDNLQSRREVLK
jgi:hypothetical protein